MKNIGTKILMLNSKLNDSKADIGIVSPTNKSKNAVTTTTFNLKTSLKVRNSLFLILLMSVFIFFPLHDIPHDGIKNFIIVQIYINDIPINSVKIF